MSILLVFNKESTETPYFLQFQAPEKQRVMIYGVLTVDEGCYQLQYEVLGERITTT